MKTTNVKCEWCGKMFDKLNKEINRSKKNGFVHCCSRSCTGSLRNSKMSVEYWKTQYKNNPTLKGHENNRRDELSPFRHLINSGRASIKKHKNEFKIDAAYLKEIWDKQDGTCPYTGIKMLLPETSSQKHKINSLRKASLDRIDSTAGYVRGNVEFVCMAINLAKNNKSKKEMLDFISDIITNGNTLGITQLQPT
jgi:hypothetical protein